MFTNKIVTIEIDMNSSESNKNIQPLPPRGGMRQYNQPNQQITTPGNSNAFLDANTNNNNHLLSGPPMSQIPAHQGSSQHQGPTQVNAHSIFVQNSALFGTSKEAEMEYFKI